MIMYLPWQEGNHGGQMVNFIRGTTLPGSWPLPSFHLRKEGALNTVVDSSLAKRKWLPIPQFPGWKAGDSQRAMATLVYLQWASLTKPHNCVCGWYTFKWTPNKCRNGHLSKVLFLAEHLGGSFANSRFFRNSYWEVNLGKGGFWDALVNDISDQLPF